MIIYMLQNLVFVCLIPFYIVFKNFSHFSSVVTLYFKAMAQFVCCMWNSLEQIWGSECAARGFVMGVCVCVSFSYD